MKKLAGVCSSFLVLVAGLFVGTASAWFVHQPKVPQELLKK